MMTQRTICLRIYSILLIIMIFGLSSNSLGQAINGKKISSELFGLFFEDINYAADGGLYAELIQNRSFEYLPSEQKGWNSFSYWEYISERLAYGTLNVETSSPIHPNNPHYMVLNIENIGSKGVGLKNSGFAGIVIKAGENYNFSIFIKQLSKEPVNLSISLQDSKGKVLTETSLITSSSKWKKYTATLSASTSCDSASLAIIGTSTGKIALDVVSLFPEKTFKNHANGLRPDLAQMLADLKPKFIRFPGGCLAHGDGLGNMYRWKNTIGPIETRKEQRNIWNYNQTAGLGYYEFFQFCEDIGAKPLPVLPAAVCCQNSGNSGGKGQKAIPMCDMKEYVQEVLDLIEWANGSVNSKWGAKRAAAGHPASFNLHYVGIGNEDKISPEFEERFKMIVKAVKEKYPQIEIIGTAGPFHSGEDFNKGWKLATDLKVPIVDEHYYTDPKWFISNQNRYDKYDRKGPKVYLGEYASWGNKLRNAIAEAAYMISLERNGDVVSLASYAPLLAKKNFTQWKTDLIFFDNTTICPTPNYYVQKMFSTNQGDEYFENVITKDEKNNELAASCVRENKTGDVIIKFVNFGNDPKIMTVNLAGFANLTSDAEQTVLQGNPEAENTFDSPKNIVPVISSIKINRNYDYSAPPMSLTVIRIKTKN